ncbi:vesicle transport protein GOT1A isoform X1 [Betta splendens]|uniref:Vesicle transport protein GOT1A isoform X1 n=1 Tax=Betta splendens TaxID=158456 RepID=A0A9W2XT36_BETSP|nr:vesicle transport protein GOT1A isoform X1 [Betta splendens]XP_055364760.1 vesicle transport protein GOT1A isoform X1 [Betta splendens]
MVEITELQKIGIGVMGFGLFFLLFGVLLYFDSVLLAFGNILFLSGLTFIIGFRRTAKFFFQKHKFRGSFFFLGGVSLVLCRWSIIGMLVESYGFILLFSDGEMKPHEALSQLVLEASFAHETTYWPSPSFPWPSNLCCQL